MKRSILNYSLIVIGSLFLFACAMSPNKRAIKTNEFYIVTAKASDTFASLAKEYLGDSRKAELIERYNPNIAVTKGAKIAIARENFFPSAVFHDEYQVVPVLCYHQFTTNTQGRTRMEVPLAEFKQQMAYLHNNGYSVIDIRQFKAFIAGGHALPRKSVVITIDDGFKSFNEHALPILEYYNFPATMFIYPDFVGGRLAINWQQIIELEKHPLITIGSHSKTHHNLARNESKESLSAYKKRLQKEVKYPDERFKQYINRTGEFFAYPFGDTSAELVNILSEQNYKLGLTVERGVNAAYTSPYFVKRNMVFGGNSLDDFVSILRNTYKGPDLPDEYDF